MSLPPTDHPPYIPPVYIHADEIIYLHTSVIIVRLLDLHTWYTYGRDTLDNMSG